MSSVSSSLELKKKQQRIEMLMQGAGIPYEQVDVSVIAGAKDKMREMMGDPKALVPQLFHEEESLGSLAELEAFIEDGGTVAAFFKQEEPAAAGAEGE